MGEKKKDTIKNVVSLSAMIVFFKILSFLKQSVTAYYYGATPETDSYYIAYGFIIGLISAAVGALTISTIATYTKIRVDEGNDNSAKLINSLIEISFPVLIVLVLLIVLFAPWLSKMIAPGCDAEQLATITRYIRILSPCLLILCVQFTTTSVLDSNKSFFVPRTETFVYSIASILACVFFSKLFGINALLVAQLLACLGFSILLICNASRYHRFALVSIKNVPGLKETALTMLPLLIGNSVIHINELIDKAITTGLGDGATSSLYYSQTLNQFVTGVMVAGVTNVLLADFSEEVAFNRLSNIKEKLSKANNFLICVLLAISIIVFFGAKDIVKIVYFRGNFSEEAVKLTSRALVGYSFGFCFIAIGGLFSTTLYAFRETKKTLISCVISILMNVFLSIVLSRIWGIIGVTLGTCLSSVVGLLINYLFLKKYINNYPIRYHLITLLKCLPFAGLLGAFCWAIVEYSCVSSVIKLVLFLLGFIIYIFILKFLRISEINEVVHILFGRIKCRNAAKK